VNEDDPRDPAIDAAYRAAAREEPPRELDERILAEAHRAVSARPAPVGRSFAQRWRVPVALAATVVLSATVTLMIYESEKSPPTPETRRDEGLREIRAAPASPPAKDAGKMESGASPPAPSGGSLRSKIEARPPGVAGDEEAARQAPPQRTQELKANERQSTPAAAPAPFSTRPATAPPSPAEPLEKRRAASGAASAPAAEDDRGPSLSRERALADRPAGRSEREAATGAPLGQTPIGATRSLVQSPEEWIAEIRKLKQAGRTDEANRLLAEFRERFTDYPIPEDLR